MRFCKQGSSFLLMSAMSDTTKEEGLSDRVVLINSCGGIKDHIW